MPFEFLNAAAPIVGSLIGAHQALGNQREATSANKEAMQNRHQWEVNDLKAAGLNPILSAGGQGTGGMPASTGAPVPDYGATLTNALQTGSNIDKQKAEIENIVAQTSLTWQTKNKVITEIANLNQLMDESFQRTRGLAYANANEHDRTMFLQENEWLIKAKATMDYLKVQPSDAITILSGVFKVPTKFIEQLLYKKKGLGSYQKKDRIKSKDKEIIGKDGKTKTLREDYYYE